MDMSKRDELYENKTKQDKCLKEAFSRMMGVSSVVPVSSDSNSAVSNRGKLGKKQGVSYPSKAFKEEEEELEIGADADAGADEIPPEGDELAVADDMDASGIDDSAEDLDGPSETKMNADAVAQAYLSQLPSDIPIEADDQGIVFTEFHDDQNGPFKVLLFPADMSISEVGEVKEPAQAESPLDIEDDEEGMDDLGGEEGMDDLGGEEGMDDLGGEEAPEEEELAEAEMSKGAQDGPVKPKIDGEEESAKLNDSPVMEEGVNMEAGAKDGIEDPTQTSNDDGSSRQVNLTEEEDEECEEDEEELTESDDEEDECEDDTMPEDEMEVPVLRESAHDRRLRKKGLLGNDRDPAAEEAEREAERDPMRAGRKSWQAMMESRKK